MASCSLARSLNRASGPSARLNPRNHVSMKPFCHGYGGPFSNTKKRQVLGTGDWIAPIGLLRKVVLGASSCGRLCYAEPATCVHALRGLAVGCTLTGPIYEHFSHKSVLLLVVRPRRLAAFSCPNPDRVTGNEQHQSYYEYNKEFGYKLSQAALCIRSEIGRMHYCPLT